MTNAISLGAARAQYYQRNGFGDDGGDSLAWVPIKILGLTVRIPNTDGRRRAVKIHDLHHVVTGFKTDLPGETEIAAWELASGCWRWPAALVLNLFALAIGLVLAPRRVTRAWALGRRTKNLYGEPGIEQGVDHLLPRDVADVRHQLGLDGPHPGARPRHVLAVVAIGIPVLVTMIAIVAAPLVGLAAAIAAMRV